MNNDKKVKTIDYFGYDSNFLKIKIFFSLKARKKMYKKFIDLCKPTNKDEILDLGVTPDTILADSNFFEKMYPYKDKITICSIEDCKFMVKKYKLKSFVKIKPHQRLPFKNKQFDKLFCSAVLEHVGTRENQEFFLKECLRVSKEVFMITPNRYFFLEMHTFIPLLHWLPWKWFQKILNILKKDFWANINNLNLLSKRNIKNLNNDIYLKKIKTLGMTSNYIILNKNIIEK